MSFRVFFTQRPTSSFSICTVTSRRLSRPILQRYTDAIVSYCETLRTVPHRGTKRNDVRPGLRITNYRKCAAFDVHAESVSITGVFYTCRSRA